MSILTQQTETINEQKNMRYVTNKKKQGRYLVPEAELIMQKNGRNGGNNKKIN